MSFTRGIEFICGQRGTGKTKYLVSRVLRDEPRLLVYDHMAELVGRAPMTITHTLEDTIDAVHRSPRGFCRVCYVPANGASPEEFAVVSAIPFSVRDLVLVVDEVDQLAGTQQNLPPQEFKRLIHFGRHFGASIVACARRAADVTRALTSQSRRVTVFAQSEPGDIKYLVSLLGPRAAEAKELPDLEYLAFEGRTVSRGRIDPAA